MGEFQEVGYMKLNSLRVKFLAGFLTLFLGSFIVFFGLIIGIGQLRITLLGQCINRSE